MDEFETVITKFVNQKGEDFELNKPDISLQLIFQQEKAIFNWFTIYFWS